MTTEFICTKCKKEIHDGEIYIATGNKKIYHHPKCSENIPLFNRRIGRQ
jgi:hypothetical protein